MSAGGAIALQAAAERPCWAAWGEQATADGKPIRKAFYGPGQQPLTLADARALAPRVGNGHASGVALVLGSEIMPGHSVGSVILHGCRDPQSGTLTPWAAYLVEEFRTHTEAWVSGTGLRLFFAYRTHERTLLQRHLNGAVHGRWEQPDGGVIELRLGGAASAIADLAAVLRIVPAEALAELIRGPGPTLQAPVTAETEPTQPPQPEASLGSTIPGALLTLPRWILWREVVRRGVKTKVPFTIHNRAADATKPTDWAGVADAMAVLERLPGGFDGLGIVLGDLGNGWFLIGIDLDSCIVDGVLAEWAKPFLDAAPSYTEVSPSGRGLKVFLMFRAEDVREFLDWIGVARTQWGCKRSIPGEADSTEHGPAIEIYCSHRFFTVTGNAWPQTPAEILVLDRVALQRLAALVPGTRRATRQRGNGEDLTLDASKAELDPEALNAKLEQAKRNNTRLRARWDGDTQGMRDTTGSAFDMAIGAHLKGARFSFAEMREACMQCPHGTGDKHRDDPRHWERIWTAPRLLRDDETEEYLAALDAEATLRAGGTKQVTDNRKAQAGTGSGGLGSGSGGGGASGGSVSSPLEAPLGADPSPSDRGNAPQTPPPEPPDDEGAPEPEPPPADREEEGEGPQQLELQPRQRRSSKSTRDMVPNELFMNDGHAQETLTAMVATMACGGAIFRQGEGDAQRGVVIRTLTEAEIKAMAVKGMKLSIPRGLLLPVPLTPADVQDFAEQRFDVVRLRKLPNKDEYVAQAADFRSDLAHRFIKSRLAGLRPLCGVAYAPIMRDDGSVVATSGYDATTRLWVVDGIPRLEIPERPTGENALVALSLLSKLLAEHPFEHKADHVAALAMLMVPALRASISNAPLLYQPP
jgi:hypothetical protein